MRTTKDKLFFRKTFLPTMTETNLCLCNSGAAFADCCEPLLSGKRAAPTALALMRARYTAYVLRDINYLMASWYPSTRPFAINPATTPDWQGLQIIRTEKGAKSDTEGVVEFIATALTRDGVRQFREVSRFVKEEGLWFYTDGDTPAEASETKKTPKVGRNEPCPCGSGKKYKKCCSP